MIQENEVIMFLIGIGALLFEVWNRDQLNAIRNKKFLIMAFHFLVLAWLITILEGFIWGDTLNILEHFCYAVSGVLISIWTWKATRRREET